MDLFDFLEDTKALKVEPKPWMKTGEYHLIRATNDTLPKIIDDCIASGLYSLDLETTGLNNCVYDGETVDKIVGCCLSPDGKHGYYIPLRHKNGIEHNVKWSLWKSEMARLIASPARAIFHNGQFDQEFLQFCGGDPLGEWDDPKKWEDTMILAYLRDTRTKEKGLKPLSKQILGLEMIELDELFPDGQKKSGGLDFSELDPSWEPVTWYGASDAICTWKLYPILSEQVLNPNDGVPGQRVAYFIEKQCLPSTRWMERARIMTDPDKVRELIRLGQKEWMESLEDVYESTSSIVGRNLRPGYYRILRGTEEAHKALAFDADQVTPGYMERVHAARDVSLKYDLDPTVKVKGKKPKVHTVTKRVPSLTVKGATEDVDFPIVYDVLVPEQLGALLRECKVPGLKVTEKSGQVATDQEELDRVLGEAGDKFPFTAKIKRFREVSKALSTYLLPLLEDAHPDHSIRARFNAFSIDTGRFNAPSSRNPSLDGGTRLPIHGIPATYDPNRPACLGRIRECIVARKGKVITAIDFSGVELRIVTNLSGEPKWYEEFYHCSSCDKRFPKPTKEDPIPVAPPPFCPDCGSDKIGDLHTLTGISVYGEDAPKKDNWKQLRGFAKACNFALCYGGGGNAVCTSIGCDKNEGWRIKEKFDKTYLRLAAWWKEQHAYARKHKFVITAFGRRYPLPDIDSELGGFRSKAERNATNGPIQGTSADITKLAMGLIYKECKARGWLEKVHMLITMHDELVFEIDLDILEEAINLFVPIMCRNSFIERLGWVVPLTSDVEIGPDWTVKWDLKKMRHKGECPPELAGCFKNLSVKDKKAEGEKGEKKKEAPPAKAEVPTRTFKLKGYSLGEVETLAQLIHAGQSDPSAKLKVLGPNDEDLTPHLSVVWGGRLPMVGKA